ncbi:MAG: hypothetical protein NC394_06235 [Bacteroides sp.]|nr:hypothetical protein [Bacteroides sp.]
MKIRSRLKYIAVFITVALCLVLAGCGATVDTSLSADGDFSGKRVMTLTLSESDLKEYIKGGAAAVESTVKSYKPDELSYSSKTVNGSLVYEFTLEFNGIEDYRAKIASVFAANPNNKTEYKIEYENVDSPFKSSTVFSENFTSIDLLGWLTYGLQKQNIVDHSSTSDWYETGSSKLVINGKEYSTGSRMNMSDSESNCAQSVEVDTRVDSAGRVERSFTFVFNETTAAALSENGTELEEYFSALAAGSAYRSEVNVDYGTRTYIIELGELSPEEISAKTAQILLDDGISFDMDISAVPGSYGEMRIAVSEKINASAYLQRSANYLLCRYYMPDGTEISYDSSSASVYSDTDRDGNRCFSYYPDGEAQELGFAWTPEFEKYAVNMGLSGNSLSLSLKMSVSEAMNETAQSILKEKLENSLAEGMKLSDFSEDGFKGYEVRFDSKTAVESYESFVSYYTGKTGSLDFNALPASNGSPFTKQNMYSVSMDMRAISGSEPVELVFDKPLGKTVHFTEGSFDVGDENPVFTASLSIVLVTEEINLAGVILAILTAAAFIGFALVVLISLKGWIADVKNVSASAKAKAAERAAAVQAAPVQTPAAPAAPNPTVTNAQTAPQADTSAPAAVNASASENKENDVQSDSEEEELI